METYLIRHTTPNIPKGTCYGASDIDVVDTFGEEAAAVKAVLPILQENSLFVSSPLIRCKKLAHSISMGQPILIEQPLKEMSFGDWELQKWKEIDRVAMNAWFPNFVTVAPPNGESFQEVYNRANKVYDQYIAKEMDQLFIVAHSAIIRAMLCKLQQTPLKDAFKENMDYGVVYKIINGNVTQLK